MALVYAAPETAEEHAIVATPTLIRIDPPPAIRLVGDISNTNRALALFGISPA